MSAETSDGLAPHRCRERDLAALVAILAVLEGELLAGEIPDRLADRLRARLRRAGVLAPGASAIDLGRSLGDLNQRLRQALGEYDEPVR